MSSRSVLSSRFMPNSFIMMTARCCAFYIGMPFLAWLSAIFLTTDRLGSRFSKFRKYEITSPCQLSSADVIPLPSSHRRAWTVCTELRFPMPPLARSIFRTVLSKLCTLLLLQGAVGNTFLVFGSARDENTSVFCSEGQTCSFVLSNNFYKYASATIASRRLSTISQLYLGSRNDTVDPLDLISVSMLSSSRRYMFPCKKSNQEPRCTHL